MFTQVFYRYETARKIKVKQDEYCAKALDGQWQNLGEFPEELQWEALVDVLRGRVKVGMIWYSLQANISMCPFQVHNHCYEAVDLDGLVRVRIISSRYSAILINLSNIQLTNEFKFSIAAFHHAHETYLVPDLLKKAYGAGVFFRFIPHILMSFIGSTPAIALFATNGRYKREAYRGSEFAPRILAEHGLRVVMKVRFSEESSFTLTD